MKNVDLAGGLFLFLLGGIICFESYRLGIGTLGRPATGFMSFLTGALLAICGAFLFVRSVFTERNSNVAQKPMVGFGSSKVLIVAASLIVYSMLLSYVGYLICTFLLLTLLFNLYFVKGWPARLIAAAAITLITFYAFRVLLNCPLPRGIFSFGF
jgi:hypothetical protein